MSSLAQLADITRDSSLMGCVKKLYDNGRWDIRDDRGWSIELTSPGSNPDMDEMNNTGDKLDTAMILGRWGYTHYYHDAERILRRALRPRPDAGVGSSPEGKGGRRVLHRRATLVPQPLKSL